MLKIETETLLDGVRFAYVHTADYKNAGFAVGFKYKSRRGSSSADLILSHLLFRSSEDYPSNRLFSRRLEELYATELSVQSLRYGDFRTALFQATFLDEPYAADIPDFTRAVLSLVAGALLRPASDSDGLFRGDETEREKSALLDRIRGVKNSKSAYAFKRISELSADPRRYDVPEYGTEEEARNVTAELIRRRYRAMLYRSEICFIYAGSLPKEKVLSLIFELFGGILTPRAPLAGKPCMPRRAAHRPILRASEETDGEQAILALSYRIPFGFGEIDGEVVPMLSAVLSDAPMSLLFSEVREKGGYCYSIRAVVRSANRRLYILCGIAPGTERQVERAVTRVLTRIRAGKIDGALTEGAKNYVKMTVTTVFENVEDTVGFLLFRILFDRETNPDAIFSNVERVTETTLADCLKKTRPDAVFLLSPKGGSANG